MRRILILLIIMTFVLVRSVGFGAVSPRASGVSPGANSTTCVVTTPAGLASGDLMVGHVVWAVASVATITAPANWTQLQQLKHATTTSFRSAIFWKVADAADAAAANFTFSNTTSGSNGGAISAWTGFDTTTPIGASSVQGNAASTKITCASITTTAPNSVLLVMGSIYNNNNSAGYAIATSNPASWTESYDRSLNLTLDIAACMGYATRPETTATGTGTITTLSDPNIGFLVAITPGPVTTKVIVVD